MEASTARACLRRLSLFVNSMRIDHASSRGITTAAAAGSATCRSTSSKRPSVPRAGVTGYGAPSPGARGWSRPWRGRSRLPSGSGRPSESPALLLRLLAQRLELGLQPADPLDELLDRLAHRVREVRLVQVDLAGHPLTVTVCYPARNTHHNGVRRHLADDHGSGADAAAVADLERTDDLRAGPDDDVVAEGRVTFLTPETRPAQCHALEQRDVRAHSSGLADHDAHAVVNEETGTDRRRRVDLDAGDEPRHVRDAARRRGPPVIPEPAGPPAGAEWVHAGIAPEHRQRRPGGG